MSVGGMNVEHVPYRGSMPALQDMMSGNVVWMFETISTTLQFHRQGRVRILGYAHAKRAPAAPDIPTVIEAGVPGYEAYTFNLVLGPANTPKDVVDTIDQATRKLMTDKALHRCAGEDRGRAGIRHDTRANGKVHQGRAGQMGARDQGGRREDRVGKALLRRQISDSRRAAARCRAPV